VIAKVEIVWPHGGLPAERAMLANITAYIFLDDALSPPPCDWDPTVRLWMAVNDLPARPVQVGKRRLLTERGRSFPVWDFNDVNVGAARIPRNRLHFFVTVDGAPTRRNIWVHAIDGRTVSPQPVRPQGVVSAPPAALDARIQAVSLRGDASIERTERLDITALLTERDSLRAIPPGLNWHPTVRLHWSVNAESEPDFRHTIVGTPREVAEDGLTYLVWDFRDVYVGLARNPANRYAFWITVDGVPTASGVWVYGTDVRTRYPRVDLPSRSCLS